jgi:VIT1/CCC1 family predicted Fe2+/Mn2+ transporter
MIEVPHQEKHFTAADAVRDVVIGMSDGLTVPFALAAGLSGAIAQSRIVVTAGLAEVAAGSIAMGLGGFLAARSERDHYRSERAREAREIEVVPDTEAEEVAEILETYGLTPQHSRDVVAALRTQPDKWIDFMMRFELGLEEPDPKRAWRSALTIAFAYVAGGLIPLMPYMLEARIGVALRISIGITLLALAVFGWVKGRFTGVAPRRGAIETTVIGGLAAAAAFTIARLIS